MLQAILNDAQKESPKPNYKQLPSHLPKLRMQIVLDRKLWRDSPDMGNQRRGPGQESFLQVKVPWLARER